MTTASAGTIRGVIDAYLDLGSPDPALVAARLRVDECSLAEAVAGTVTVRMPRPADANLLVKDLRDGYDAGGLDPVPEGSLVTFTGAEPVSFDEIEASGYEAESIVRPESLAP